MVTRPVDQAKSLAAPLQELGASVVCQPAIEIGPPDDWKSVDRSIESLSSTDIIVFCSRNGVRFYCERLRKLGFDARKFSGVTIAVVGKSTASELSEFGLHADLVPPAFHAQSLADEMSGKVEGKRITIVRASRGKDNLAERLAEAGAVVEQVVSYSHRNVSEVEPGVRNLAHSGQIDWITITSSETARSLHDLFGDMLSSMKIATISPITSEAVRALGHTVQAEADPHTIPSLVDSILEAES